MYTQTMRLFWDASSSGLFSAFQLLKINICCSREIIKLLELSPVMDENEI